MSDTVLLVRGDILGETPYQPTNLYNPSDSGFAMQVNNAQRVGAPEETFRLVGYQNINGAEAFSNGQFWKLQSYSGPANPTQADLDDPANWTDLYTGMVPKPDLVAGLGLTPTGVVFEVQGLGGGGRHIVLDTRASFPETPGTVVLPGKDENGNSLDTGPLEFDTIRNLDLGPPCFLRGTLILTPTGPRPIEDLRVGDAVVTRDRGAQPILWIGQRRMTTAELDRRPHLRPIRIRAGALGPSLPETDLLVSPQHRILVRSALAERIAGEDEVLVAAKHLLASDGIEAARDCGPVDYFHILFDRHEVVFANGAETESFYPGPQALRMVDRAARAELLELFPELRETGFRPAAARTFLTGGLARRLLRLLERKDQPLVAA